jgi:hypothetical protein
MQQPPPDTEEPAEAGVEASSVADAKASEAEASPPDAGADVSAARCDRAKPFGAPALVASVNSSADESSARLSPDELTLYLGSARNGNYDMFVAKRADAGADFSTPTALPNLSTSNDESHGVVTADGLTMYFGLAKTGNPFHLAVAVRPSVVAEFGAPEVVANVNSSASENDPMIDDGAENIYFMSTRASNNVDIYRATRMASGAFGTPTPLAEINTNATEHMPVITPDGLALYFASDRGGGDDVWIARRSSPSQAFLAPVLVAELSSASEDAPTWVSSDECTIYLRRGASGAPRDIWSASRPK